MNKHKLLSVLLYSFHVGWWKYIPVRNVSYCTLVHNTPEVSLSHVTRTVKTYCVLSFVEVVCWFFIDILRGESVCQVRHQLGLLMSEPERNRRKERFLLYLYLLWIGSPSAWERATVIVISDSFLHLIQLPAGWVFWCSLFRFWAAWWLREHFLLNLLY